MRRLSFGVAFGGIWLIVGLSFLTLSAYLLFQERRFAIESRIAEGIVLAKDIRRSGGSGNSSSRGYYVRYRFTPDGSQWLEGETQVSRSAWLGFEERAPLEVAYLPERPHNNRVRGHSKIGLLLIFLGVGTLLSVVGGTIVGVSLVGSRSRDRLLREGTRVTGRITRLAPMNLTINGHRQCRVEYEYADLQGRTQRGRSRVAASEAGGWTEGDAVEVWFDPRKPARSTWEAPRAYTPAPRG